MSRLHDIRARLAELRSEIETLSAVETRSAEQEGTLGAALDEWDALTAEAAPLEERAAKVEAVRQTVLPTAQRESSNAAPAVVVRHDPFELLETRGRDLSPAARAQAVVDANLRAIDGRVEDGDNQAHFEAVLKRHAKKDTDWALNLLARSRDEYEGAWSKYITGRTELLDPEERAALQVGSNTAGGYLVPTHLDPTIILTNAGSSNAIRGISRVVTLTEGNIWNGVTSAGVTASWDGELAEVSDDSPTFGRASVPLKSAQAFVQATFESFEDISGLASDVLMLFGDARDRLEGAAHALGTGTTNQPTGIVTALGAGSQLATTTAGSIGLVDVHGLYAAVPQRWRGRSTWVMGPTFDLAIKALGSAVSASYSTDLTQGPSNALLNRPVVESDDMPNTAFAGTAAANGIVLGDFSNFVIADKPGSLSIEFVPLLFNTGNNLPDGRRGWYMHWRNGSDSVNDSAFRMLVNKTS